MTVVENLGPVVSMVPASRRWYALCALFPVGAVFSSQTLSADSQFVLLTCLNMLAAIVLIAAIRKSFVQHLWAWMMLAAFLDGYFLQLYWYAYKLHSDPTYLQVRNPELSFLNARTMASSYYYFTFGFLVFVVAAHIAVSLRQRALAEFPSVALNTRDTRTFLVALFTAAVFAMLAAIQLAFGLGQLGLTSAGLPLHLETPLALAVQHLGPAVLLLCAWILDTRNRHYSNIVVLMLLGLAGVETYITTSRGVVASMMLPVVLMWVASRQFTKPRKTLVLIGVIAVLLARPAIGALRAQRLTNEASSSQGSFVDTQALVASLVQSATRVSGAYGVWQAAQHPQNQFGLDTITGFVKPYYLGQYFTYDVVGLPRYGLADYRTPGLVGGAMVLGGGLGVIAVVGFAVGGIAYVSRRVMRLQSWPVALGILGNAVLQFTSEVGSVFMAKAALSILVVEMLYRHALTRKRRRPGRHLAGDAGLMRVMRP